MTWNSREGPRCDTRSVGCEWEIDLVDGPPQCPPKIVRTLGDTGILTPTLAWTEGEVTGKASMYQIETRPRERHTLWRNIHAIRTGGEDCYLVLRKRRRGDGIGASLSHRELGAS